MPLSKKPIVGLGCLCSLLTSAMLMAHTHEPSWISAETGIHAWTTGPTAVRADGEAWLTVHLINLEGSTCQLQRLTLLRNEQIMDQHPIPASLPSAAEAVAAYRASEAALCNKPTLDQGSMQALLQRQAWALEMASEATVCCTLKPGADLTGKWEVEIITIDPKGIEVTQCLPVTFSRSPSLPDGTAESEQWVMDRLSGEWRRSTSPLPSRTSIWFAGDQHLHTTWSLDAHVLDGTEEGPAEYADAARARGLDWIMITDHSNIHAWWFGEWFFTPEQHELARQEAADYRANEGWPVLYSQEMGLGRTGFWDLPSHMLVYPLDTFDAPYLENPSDGLVFGHANCEDEQVIIDRINKNGCYGFIAHPYEEGELSYAQWDWDNGATGWAGLELWSNADGQFQQADLSTLNRWHSLLSEIAPPTQGMLADRQEFPTRAPVGLGNSDAHHPGAIGAVFTYARLDAVNPKTLRDAFLSGRCIASDGPLLTVSANQSGIGEVALLPDGNARVVIRLETTTEFGPISDYTLVLEGDGEEIMAIPTQDVSGYAAEFVIQTPKLWQDRTYLTAWAQRTDLQRLALTNPVWLQKTDPGDVDGSGVIDVNDLLSLLADWGPCEGCPADGDWNGHIDVNDILLLLSHWN